MRVAVQEVFRAAGVHQPEKRLEAPVRGVVQIAEAPGRSVGDHDVRAARLSDRAAQLVDATLHLPFGILMGSAVVPERTAEPEDADPVRHDEMAVDVLAPLRRGGVVAPVVIAVHVQQLCMAHRDKKGEVRRLQVAAGQNEVIRIEPPRDVMVPKRGTLHVGNSKDLHLSAPPPAGSGPDTRRARGRARGRTEAAPHIRGCAPPRRPTDGPS